MDQVLRINIAIALMCCFCSIDAQPYDLNRLKQWQLKGFAESASQQNDYHSAILYTNQLYKNKPKVKFLHQLANLHYLNRDYTKSVELFTQLDSITKHKSKEYQLYAALSYKSLGAYDKALGILKKIRYPKSSKSERSQIKKEIDGCKLALNPVDSLNYFSVEQLNKSVNSRHIEINPVFISDSVFIYGSSKIDSLAFYSSYKLKPKRHFYKAQKFDSTWIGHLKVSNPYYNNVEFDTGCGVYSLDKTRFYFTKSKPDEDGKIRTSLFVSKLTNGAWDQPTELNSDINKPRYSSSEPAIGTCFNPDLEVLYFVSDRNNGQGGTDIWYTIYDTKTGSYGKVVNAGIFINTHGDEATPFYDNSTHTLYFSSTSWGGLGGLDVYKSQGELVNWSTPINLDNPVNSPADDLFFSINTDGTQGLFTSNRFQSNNLTHNTGCDDIYFWELDIYEKVWVTGTIESEQYNLINHDKEASTEPLKNVELNLYLEKDTADLMFLSKIETDNDGRFNFSVLKEQKYQLIIDDVRVLDKTISFNTKDIELNEVNTEIKTSVVKTIPKEPIKLENIYYEFNKAELTNASIQIIKNTLLKLMTEYPNTTIEVRSHTDNQGGKSYNLRLSKQRAINVKKYLVSMGIDEAKIVALGFGEKEPIAPNTNSDGSDNPKGREENRRTEFRIMSDNEYRRD